LAAVSPQPGFAQTRLVEPRTVALTLPAEAVLEATRQATVATQVSGRIVEVRTEAGQRVAAGQVLMRIDAREAAENVAAAKAQLAQAEAHYQRTLNLFQKKFVSQAALDQAEAALKSARAQAAAAGAGASHATVTAPISGIVAQRHAELGDLALPGKPLITVFDPKGLRAVANIPQYKLKAVQAAKLAKVEWVEDKSRRWQDGVRIEILPTIDAQSHTATARVYLADAEGLVPGMAARVHFVIGQAQKLTVPPAAILRRGEIAAVYVVKDGKPVLRQVRLGEPVADGEIEVLAGLAAGETVSLEPVKTGIEMKQAK
ncbi:MAG: efflux RND transporter periplasmic adaptor subunit, partial [Rhodocyclaceae bacterium]|nr:efflux RND transporter periplasmic adaptor subunit [Rhodocyclaceae bacterium]